MIGQNATISLCELWDVRKEDDRGEYWELETVEIENVKTTNYDDFHYEREMLMNKYGI